jgi:hypothetical protein
VLRSSNPREVIYDTAAPSSGIRLGQLFVDTDDTPPTLYIATSLSPITFSPLGGGGGGGSPGGANTQVQFNNAGAFGGDAGFTFDAGVTFTGLKFSITDTAYLGASLPFDVQVSTAGGFRFFGERNNASADSVILGGANPAFRLRNAAESTDRTAVESGGLRMVSSGSLSWASSSTNQASGRDLYVVRDAAATLAQRNGTNAQTSRIYNTYTDASNYERGTVGWTSNVFHVGTDQLGTGAARNMELRVGGASRVLISSSAVTMQLNTVIGNNTLSGNRPVILARTADGTEGNAGHTITNRGATGTVTRTLQSFTDNLTFIRIASQALRIEPPAGGRFLRANGTLEAVDKYLELASDGALLTLQNDGTNWLCVAERGTITVEP